MGAWGTGYFEDDAAFDFMADVEESKNPKQTIQNAFQDALKADYLECDQGNAVIVAAAYVDGQTNGTKFSSPERDEPLDIDTFSERYPNYDFSGLKQMAGQALQKVLTDESELKELWEETEEFEAWRDGVEKLIRRLNK